MRSIAHQSCAKGILNSSLHLHLCGELVAGLEGCTNLTPLDLAEGNGRGLLDLVDVLRLALGSITRTRVGRLAVEPRHEVALVIPQREREHHSAAQSVSHTLHSTVPEECRGVLSLAVVVCHGDVAGLVLENDTVLDVLADDRLEDALLSRELSDDGERLRCVELEVATVEALGTLAVRVLRAAGLVAKAVLATLSTLATEQAGLRAGVRGNSRSTAVSLPDVHLVTADTISLNVTLYKVSN
jgi:hypothetical protein